MVPGHCPLGGIKFHYQAHDGKRELPTPLGSFFSFYMSEIVQNLPECLSWRTICVCFGFAAGARTCPSLGEITPPAHENSPETSRTGTVMPLSAVTAEPHTARGNCLHHSWHPATADTRPVLHGEERKVVTTDEDVRIKMGLRVQSLKQHFLPSECPIPIPHKDNLGRILVSFCGLISPNSQFSWPYTESLFLCLFPSGKEPHISGRFL